MGACRVGLLLTSCAPVVVTLWSVRGICGEEAYQGGSLIAHNINIEVVQSTVERVDGHMDELLRL